MRGVGGERAIFARMHLFMNERINEGRNDISFLLVTRFVDTHPGTHPRPTRLQAPDLSAKASRTRRLEAAIPAILSGPTGPDR